MSRIRTRADRYRDQRAQDAAIARALLEAEPTTQRTETPRSRLDHELDLLRGIPVIGVQGGRGGAILGSKPGIHAGTSRGRGRFPGVGRTANSREAQPDGQQRNTRPTPVAGAHQRAARTHPPTR